MSNIPASGAWQQAKFGQIPGIETGIEAARQAVNLTASTIRQAAAILDQVADILKLLPTSSDYTAAMAAICEWLYNLFESGCYFFYDATPFLAGTKPDGVDGFLKRWDASFEDRGDAARPQFAGSADLSAIFLLAGAPDLPSFAALWEALKNLWAGPINDPAANNDAELSWPERIEQGMSTPPDWYSGRLGDFVPVYDELVQILSRLLDGMKEKNAWVDQLKFLTAAIEDRAKRLEALAAALQTLMEQLAVFTQSSLYELRVDASSLDSLRSTVQSADRSGIKLPAESYVFGVCFLAGGAEIAPFKAAWEAMLQMKQLAAEVPR